MPVKYTCPGCKASHWIGYESNGKKGRCNRCGTIFTIHLNESDPNTMNSQNDERSDYRDVVKEFMKM